MCRQLGIITTQNDSSITAPALRVFKRIITDGRIPDGQPAGHHDGWGTALMRETAAQHYRSTQSGATDPVYDELIELAGQQSRGSLLVHARKASVGSKLIANTHPFVSGGLAFSHNGTILEYAKIHLAAPFNQLEGTTDSEKFFALIRQEYRSFSRGQLAEAVQSAARRIMYRNIDFTALNIILIADGLLIASRIVNEKNSFVKKSLSKKRLNRKKNKIYWI
jgi:predicted glutamine amidotransferase